MKLKKLFALSAAVVLILTGCAAPSKDSGSDSDTKVGLVTDTGGVNDKSFNQGTWEGVEKFSKETGADANYIESKKADEYASNLTNMAGKNDIVVAPGFTFESAVYITASENKDVKFVGVDFVPKDAKGKAVKLDNVQSLLFAEEQAGYLAGYVAGLQTTTNKVAFVGGLEIPPVQKFGWGFLAGVKDANPKAKVTFTYTGSFDDVSGGKTLGQQLYKNGVDIIFHAAGGTGAGVIEAAVEAYKGGNENAWVIGVDRDQYEDGKIPGTDHSIILTSALKKVDVITNKALTDISEGNFKSGEVTYTIKDDAVGLPEKNPNLTDEKALKSLDSQVKAIKAGDLTVPNTKSALTKYLGGFTKNIDGKY